MNAHWQFDVLPQDKYNQQLLDNVHPSDWENPEPNGTYNLIAIGAALVGIGMEALEVLLQPIDLVVPRHEHAALPGRRVWLGLAVSHGPRPRARAPRRLARH